MAAQEYRFAAEQIDTPQAVLHMSDKAQPGRAIGSCLRWIIKTFHTTRPDMATLLSDVQAIIAKYDEAIEVVAKAPPLNPLYDELARLRIVRAYLREVNPALRAGNIAKARMSFENFNDKWFDIEDFVRAQSLDAYVAIERGMLAGEAALLMTEKPDVAKVTALVTAVVIPYNEIVAEVQRQARSSKP